MYVDFMLRRRASLDEPSPTLNAKLVEHLVTVPGFWGAGKTVSDAPFEFPGECASLDLRTALASGLAGQISYAPRFAGYLSQDIAQSDDFISLRLNTEKTDYALFCSATLPRLIDIFGPYRAAAHTDEAVLLDDFDITRVQSQKTGRNINGRDSVYRIWPVCFFRRPAVPAGIRHRRGGGGGARRAGVRARRGPARRRVPAGDVGGCRRTRPRRAERPRHDPARQFLNGSGTDMEGRAFIPAAPCLALLVIASRLGGVAIQGPDAVLAAPGLPRRCAPRDDAKATEANGRWR